MFEILKIFWYNIFIRDRNQSIEGIEKNIRKIFDFQKNFWYNIYVKWNLSLIKTY